MGNTIFQLYSDIIEISQQQMIMKKNIQEIHNPYWIIWDAEMNHIIRWTAVTPNTKYLIPQILIIDSNQDNWNIDDNGVGCVDYL